MGLIQQVIPGTKHKAWHTVFVQHKLLTKELDEVPLGITTFIMLLGTSRWVSRLA